MQQIFKDSGVNLPENWILNFQAVVFFFFSLKHTKESSGTAAIHFLCGLDQNVQLVVLTKSGLGFLGVIVHTLEQAAFHHRLLLKALWSPKLYGRQHRFHSIIFLFWNHFRHYCAAVVIVVLPTNSVLLILVIICHYNLNQDLAL